MTYVPSDMAEAQAIGLCYIARQSGLPDIHSIRQAVVQLHPDACGWCDYPPVELLSMLGGWASKRTNYTEKAWWDLPRQSRLAAIAQAQVTE